MEAAAAEEGWEASIPRPRGRLMGAPARPPPYARPAALRNPSTTNGWLSKLVVDTASKLISASAHLFFSSSLFRKRLPPAPPPPHIPPPPEANQESRDRFEEEVLDNPPGVRRPFLNYGGTSTNSGNSYGLSELEQMLKQKTFTRSEIDRLTELLHSRTVDAPQGDEDTRTELNVPQPIGSSSGFGLSSLATNSNSSSSPTSSLSTWQPPKSSIFSSTTESPPTVFSFGASSVSAAATNSAPMVFGSTSGSLFSFTSAAAAASASSSQTLPVFGSGDQMNMEDSMAEDQPIQASAPTVPVFGQTPISNPSSGFVFGSAVPSAGNPFQFGGQQNQSTPQNPSLFSTFGSLDFAAAGNSFSLGYTGDDKANRRIVRVKHKPLRR